MIMTVTCPCGCGHTFQVETHGTKRKLSDADRARRAELMRAMRANGIGGRPKGVKNSHERSDKGQARAPRDTDTEGTEGTGA